MRAEALTWLGIGIVTATYINQRHNTVKKKDPEPVVLYASREVDPTRWRHTGVQPFDGTSYGNGEPSEAAGDEARVVAHMLGY